MVRNIAKLVGFIVRQLFDGPEQKIPVFVDERGMHYFNERGERIACVQSEITI